MGLSHELSSEVAHVNKAHDEGRLAELGYTQELQRDWGFWHNAGASFSIISVATGIIELFTYGLNTGGPGCMTVGWIIVSFFTLIVGTSMAEILSSIPTSGGPYFWAYMLAPQERAPFFAWITGWFNLIGQIAVTTAIDFGLANLISTTAEVSNGYEPSAGKTIGILAVILFSHAVVNTFSIRALKYMIYTSIALNSVGICALTIAVLAKAPTHQSAAFVFGKFYDGTGMDGSVGWSIRSSPAYVAACGALLAQYTILGYDASAHLCEETKHAVKTAPLGMITAIGASAVFGLFLLVGLLVSIQDFDKVVESKLPAYQILTDACGSGGGTVLMVLVMLCVWHCGLFSLCSNARMMFAFARDGGIPHRLHIIDGRFRSPVRTIWFGAICSFILALPSLGSEVALAGTTSIATIGLYMSYGIPIAMTVIFPGNFKRGPFNLGKWGKYAAIIACLWIGFITVVFCLPTVNPVTSTSLNYTPVALGIVTLFAFGSWALWARHWFTGRCRHHCRVCIRQLDFLGEEMVYRTDTRESGSGDQPEFRMESAESSMKNHQYESKEAGFGPPHAVHHPSHDPDNKISVSREFEVFRHSSQ